MDEDLYFCMGFESTKHCTKQRAQERYDELAGKEKAPVVFRLVPVSMENQEIVTIKKVIP